MEISSVRKSLVDTEPWRNKMIIVEEYIVDSLQSYLTYFQDKWIEFWKFEQIPTVTVKFAFLLELIMISRGISMQLCK